MRQKESQNAIFETTFCYCNNKIKKFHYFQCLRILFADLARQIIFKRFVLKINKILILQKFP